MSKYDEVKLREDIIEILDESDPEGGVWEPDELEDFWGPQADALVRYLLNRL